MILNLKKLQIAQIMEKQAIYIINSVLLPRLQYRLYSSFLSTNQLINITRIYTNIVKHKARLARSVPNSFLFNPDIYALKNLTQVQTTMLATTLLKNLNN